MSISSESDIFQPAVLLAVFLGLGVIILIFFIKWIKQGRYGEGDEIDDKNDKVKNFPADASGKHRKKEQTGSVKGVSKKKLAERENRRTARANEKGFNHPWLLATLKGHSGRVLDMDFSPNGKYLVSCADEDPDPGGMSNFDRSEASPTSESSPSSSESTKENSSPTPSPTFTRGLSRRQRKNRKRETPAPVQAKINTKIEAKKSNEVESLPREEGKMMEEVGGRTKRVVYQGLSPLKEFMGMIFSEDVFVKMLKDKYKLSKEDMARLGYPLRPEIQIRPKYFQNRTQDISYYHYGLYPVAVKRQHNWDVNAEEFIPKNESADSGNGSGGSSSSSSEEESSGSEGKQGVWSGLALCPVPAVYVTHLPKTCNYLQPQSPSFEYEEFSEEDDSASEECSPSMKLLPGTIKMKDARVRVCSRCGTFFYTTSKQYLTLDSCTYHPGRVVTLRDTCGPMQYSCCGGMHGSPGCDVAKVHVWAGPRELVDRTVFIWEAKDLANKERKSLRINVEFDFATHVKWSPDCKAFIIHRFNENSLEVYKVEKKKDGWLSANKALTFPKAHETDVIGMGIASNGKFIMTCSNKTDLVIWDLKGDQLAKVDTFLMTTTCAKISPCGRFVVASGFTPEAKAWEVNFDKSGEFKEVKQVPQLTLGGHTSGVYDVAFDVDSSHMSTVSKDGTWRLFDTKVNYKQGQDARLDISGRYELASNSSLVALSPNAEVLVVASASNLQFFSTMTGKLDYTIENLSEDHINSLLFDASGKYLLVAADRKILVFHNITGYRCGIVHASEKLKEHQTSATRERLQQLIKDSEEFLKNFE